MAVPCSRRAVNGTVLDGGESKCMKPSLTTEHSSFTKAYARADETPPLRKPSFKPPIAASASLEAPPGEMSRKTRPSPSPLSTPSCPELRSDFRPSTQATCAQGTLQEIPHVSSVLVHKETPEARSAETPRSPSALSPSFEAASVSTLPSAAPVEAGGTPPRPSDLPTCSGTWSRLESSPLSSQPSTAGPVFTRMDVAASEGLKASIRRRRGWDSSTLYRILLLCSSVFSAVLCRTSAYATSLYLHLLYPRLLYKLCTKDSGDLQGAYLHQFDVPPDRAVVFGVDPLMCAGDVLSFSGHGHWTHHCLTILEMPSGAQVFYAGVRKLWGQVVRVAVKPSAKDYGVTYALLRAWSSSFQVNKALDLEGGEQPCAVKIRPGGCSSMLLTASTMSERCVAFRRSRR